MRRFGNLRIRGKLAFSTQVHKLNQRWIGIDITHLSISQMKYCLKDMFALIEKKDYTFLGGTIAAFFGQIALLVVGWSGTAKIVSLVVYGLSLIALFSASAAYHLAKVRPKVR